MNFAKMMTVDGQGDGQRDQTGASKDGPYKDLPVLEAFPAEKTQPNAGSQEGQKPLKVQGRPDLRGPVFLKKDPGTILILSGGALLSIVMAWYFVQITRIRKQNG